MELDRHVIYGCLAAAVTAATLTTAEAVEGLPSVCAFRRLSGLPCPGCGLTRSWVLTAHGRLGHASNVTRLVRRHFGLAAPGAARSARRTNGPPARRQQQALTGLAAVWLSWALVRMARDAR